MKIGTVIHNETMTLKNLENYIIKMLAYNQ